MQDLEHLGAQKLSEDEADVYWSIPQKEFEKRKDLRDYRIFTIDPTSARDLDDALHIRVRFQKKERDIRCNCFLRLCVRSHSLWGMMCLK